MCALAGGRYESSTERSGGGAGVPSGLPEKSATENRKGVAGVGPPDPRTKVWVGPIIWRYWYSRSGGAIQGQVEEGLDPPTFSFFLSTIQGGVVPVLC